MMTIHSPQPWQEWSKGDRRYFAEKRGLESVRGIL